METTTSLHNHKHHWTNLRIYLQPILGIPLGNSVIKGVTIAHGNVAELSMVAVQEQTTNRWEKLLLIGLGLGSTTWKAIQNVVDSSNTTAP